VGSGGGGGEADVEVNMNFKIRSTIIDTEVLGYGPLAEGGG
jgi:hypothetical protein